jgi:hypothetical protein
MLQILPDGAGLTDSPNERARWFRAKADEVRAAAESMAEVETRRTMLRIAQNYESMARRLEAATPPARTNRTT